MMRNYLLIFILLLPSCYTSKQALKDISKADAVYPETTLNFCNDRYPTKETIKVRVVKKKPDTIKIEGPTLTINCDSAIKERKREQKTSGPINANFTLKCPPSTHVRDTIIIDSTRTITDPKPIKILENEITKLKATNDKETSKVAGLRRWLWRLIFIIAFLVLLIILLAERFKRKI